MTTTLRVRLKATVLIFFVATLAVVAQVDSRIVGTWVQQGEIASVWTFRADGSGFMEQQNPRTVAHFTWSSQGNSMLIATGGLRVPYIILKNDGSQMHIRNQQSSTTYVLKKQN